jgi:galactoside O-acetyltransferase
MIDDFLTLTEMASLGLGRFGSNVRISRHALLLAPDRMTIGDNVRIDAYCVVSCGVASIVIGRNVHLSAHATILGRERVEIGDFATISVRCSIFSSNDDYSGDKMTNPTVPVPYRMSQDAPVTIGPHAILGAGTIVLPGVRIGESASVGAASLVEADIPDFGIAVGVPARVIGERRRGHRELAEELLRSEADVSATKQKT